MQTFFGEGTAYVPFFTSTSYVAARERVGNTENHLKVCTPLMNTYQFN